MHNQHARFFQAQRKCAKAKAREASQAGPLVLWAGIGFIVMAFILLQSF